MKTTRVLGVCVVALAVATAAAQGPQADRDAEAIKKLLAQYQQLLKDASLEGVMKLYAADGVFMPPDAPAQSAEPAIRKNYQQIFGQETLRLTFTPVEVTTTGDWGFARVNIMGTITPKGGGNPDRVDNKALFILHRTAEGSWRIARYIFNRNAPVAGSRQ